MSASNYLKIPVEYMRFLGGLQWADDGTVVDGRGMTFAFRPQLASFLEGFASQRHLVSFAYILHLLHLMRRIRQGRPPKAQVLVRLHDEKRWPPRHGGALAGRLCPDVPLPADRCLVKPIVTLLRSPGEEWGLGSRSEVAEIPAWSPETFEAAVLERLGEMTPAEIRHWLRHGRGPLASQGSEAAEAIANRPRTLESALAELAQRDRMERATRHTAHLLGALTLPTRPRRPAELPQGGYADLTTQGRPEHLLPWQFALDSLEFVRRFAERELLYFHHEAPENSPREELVVLLDQGVRTWGDVRLGLMGAFFALGKLAHQGRIPFLVAATSNGGRAIDPVGVSAEELAILVEASDLQLHPGDALERLLEKSPGPRDVVLLTHPRNLAEETVRAAALRASPATRIFALALEEQGEATLSLLRRGHPVAIRKFRMNLAPAGHLPASPLEIYPLQNDPISLWQGNVEPIPTPLRVVVPIPPRLLLAFDEESEWLVSSGSLGLLTATRLDGSMREVLPRGFTPEGVVCDLVALLGVRGGVVAGAILNGRLKAVHYDLRRRSIKVYDMGLVFLGHSSDSWHSVPWAHCVVVRKGNQARGVDLATGQQGDDTTPVEKSGRLADACREVCAPANPPRNSPIHAVVLPPENNQPLLFCSPLLPMTGLGGAQNAKKHGPIVVHSTPHKGEKDTDKVLGGMWGGPHLVLLQPKKLAIFRAMDVEEGAMNLFIPFREFPHEAKQFGFCLSPNGQFLARQVKQHVLEVCDLEKGSPLTLPEIPEENLNSIQVHLGESSLLFREESRALAVSWHQGVWQTRRGDNRASWNPFGATRAVQGAHAKLAPPYDPKRFPWWAQLGPFVVYVDILGLVAICDTKGHLVAMFAYRKGQLAAWLPHGIRYGSPWLTGVPPTPGAREALARALWAHYP